MYLVVLSSRGNPGKVDPARFMKQMYSGRITVGGGGVGTGKAYLRIKSTYILQLITVFFFLMTNAYLLSYRGIMRALVTNVDAGGKIQIKL